MPNWMTESPSFEDHPSWQAVLNHDGSQTTHVLPYDRYNLISIYSIHVAIYIYDTSGTIETRDKHIWQYKIPSGKHTKSYILKMAIEKWTYP